MAGGMLGVGTFLSSQMDFLLGAFETIPTRGSEREARASD